MHSSADRRTGYRIQNRRERINSIPAGPRDLYLNADHLSFLRIPVSRSITIRGGYKTEKPDSRMNRASLKKSWQRPTLPCSRPHSTIGPAGLICSVRNGKRSYTRGIVTRKIEGESGVFGSVTQSKMFFRDASHRSKASDTK
jgi:hypothetical protein